MAVDDFHNAKFPRKVEWGEIDTTAPFESVKAAVSLFGEGVFGGKTNGEKLKLPAGERRLAKETELHLVQKELDKSKEQLKNAEATKAQALRELEEAKKVVEVLTQKLEKAEESKQKACEASELARLRVEELEPSDVEVSESSNKVWQTQLNVAREQHMTATVELDSARQELRRMKQELVVSMEAKAFANKQAEEAMLAAEMNTKRVEELLKDIAATNESLVRVKRACMDSEKERADIITHKDGEVGKAVAEAEQSSKQSWSLMQELDAVKDLEAKLAASTAAVESLQMEINLSKETHFKVAKAACVANENLRKVKSQIERTMMTESASESSLELKTRELEESEDNLQKATQEEAALRASMYSLRTELDQVRKELEELKDRESDAEAAATGLNAELYKIRMKLEVAAMAESKEKGDASDLSLTLQQLTAESEEARNEAEAMEEKAHQAKLEAERARVTMSAAESAFIVASKDAEAAKDAETVALGRIKALSAKTIAARASTSESCAGITVSQDEYESLNRKVKEADELANMKVAAAMAQVNAVKASEQEIARKLEVANREIEEIKLASEQALHTAERAEAAKRVLEGELKRRRECEQQKRSLVLAAAQDLPNDGKKDVRRSFIEDKSLHSQSLGKVLNIKLASPEKVEGGQSVDRSFTLKKKKQLIPNIGGIFTKKKNQVDGNSPSQQFTR